MNGLRDTLRRHVRHLLAGAAAAALAGAPAAGQPGSVGVVPVTQAAPSSGPRPVPPRSGAKRCINVNNIAGAIVFGDRAVELTMTNGQRWRLYFAQGCPTLTFYNGFYYQPAQRGKLCAGRDAIMSRAGGSCDIASIVPIKGAPTVGARSSKPPR